MAIDQPTVRSRRAILAAAAAGAAGIAASTMAVPALVAAAPGDPMKIDQDNPTTILTSITQGTADTAAFKAMGPGAGTGVEGDSATGDGVLGVVSAIHRAGASGLSGDVTGSSHEDAAVDLETGIYGWSNSSVVASGVWGESTDGYGVYGEADGGTGVGAFGVIGVHGTGFIGFEAEGTIGAGIFGDAGGAGLHVHVGGIGTAPGPHPNTAITATVVAATDVGLEAHGRIILANRSGRRLIGKGRSAIAITVPGATSSNIAVATLNASRTGRWVQAVVCATNKITIYLNGKLAAATYVSWIVLG